jgi:twinkle protein
LSKVKTRKQCPNCADKGFDTSRDNLVIYENDNGHDSAYCFSCGHLESGSSGGEDKVITTAITVADELQAVPLVDRNLKQKTVEFYGVTSKLIEDKEVERHYPRTRNGIVVGTKIRILPKSFKIRGDAGDQFFGQSLFPAGKKILIVTAGEEDAMSAYQMTEHCSPSKQGYPSVSFPNGINAKTTVKDNLEWLNSFDKVVFAVDQEDEELEQAKEFCLMLEVGKGCLAKFPLKDASDMCVAKRYQEFYNAVWNAPAIMPAGILETATELWEEYQALKHYETLPFPENWGMDFSKGTYWPSLCLLAAGTGVGKSLVAKNFIVHVFNETDKNVGIITIEEPVSLYVSSLLKINGSKPDNKDEFNKLFDKGRLVFCSPEGVRNLESLISKIRYMSISKECRYIVIDHITALIDQYGGEKYGHKNDYTAKLANKLNEVCQELKICIFMISHVRKTDESSLTYETGKKPMHDSIIGSSSLKQYAHCVYTMSRDVTDPESPLHIHIIKDRVFNGLGTSSPLRYNAFTGKLDTLKEQEEEIV